MNKTIYLIRHGQTPGNAMKRYIGTTDESLTEAGVLELKGHAYPKVEMVFSSPLKRAMETAKIIYPEQEITIVYKLRETDFGEFEGKNYQELSGNAKYQAWIDSGGLAPFPGGEDPFDVQKRAMEGLEEITEMSKDCKEIAIVTHGGIIMALVQKLFGGDYYNYNVANGKGYSFEISSDGLYSGLCNRLYTG